MNEEIFRKKFINNGWNSNESKSGNGSELNKTINLRKNLPLIIKKYKVNHLLDVPCGDFNWMKEIIDLIPNYTGGDIVKDLIDENKKKYKNINFLHLDLINNKIPKCDLLFIRDCLFHLSYEDIKKVLNNIKSSNIKYLLITNFNNHENKNIKTGQFRPLCLCNKPFYFTKPIEIIKEDEKGRFQDKHMGLWKLENIPNFYTF